MSSKQQFTCENGHCQKLWVPCFLKYVPKMYPKCTQNVPKMYPEAHILQKCTQNVPKVYPKCTQSAKSVPKVYPECTQNVPKICPKSTPHCTKTHDAWVFACCSLTSMSCSTCGWVAKVSPRNTSKMSAAGLLCLADSVDALPALELEPRRRKNAKSPPEVDP